MQLLLKPSSAYLLPTLSGRKKYKALCVWRGGGCMCACGWVWICLCQHLCHRFKALNTRFAPNTSSRQRQLRKSAAKVSRQDQKSAASCRKNPPPQKPAATDGRTSRGQTDRQTHTRTYGPVVLLLKPIWLHLHHSPDSPPPPKWISEFYPFSTLLIKTLIQDNTIWPLNDFLEANSLEAAPVARAVQRLRSAGQHLGPRTWRRRRWRLRRRPWASSPRHRSMQCSSWNSSISCRADFWQENPIASLEWSDFFNRIKARLRPPETEILAWDFPPSSSTLNFIFLQQLWNSASGWAIREKEPI